MRKALIVASVGGFIDFEKGNIKRLQSMGYEVHIACSKKGWEDYLQNIPGKLIDIPFDRSPFSKTNIIAYKELKDLINSEDYQLIHCHTPVAGILTRFAARKKRSSCRIIYTAHGFHFYKGAPVKNWLFYFPAEWIASWLTDVLITINTEDYSFAKKHMHAKTIEYVPGVGIDVNAIKALQINRERIRKELGVNETQKLLISVGEINKNKNHRVVIEAIAKLGNKKLIYCIAGVGELRDELISLSVKLGVEEQIHFLGYRNDVIALDKAADVFCFPSHREGLSVALMEAIASGTKILCSDIRGNRDLAKGNPNVLLFNQKDVSDCSNKLCILLEQEKKTSNAIMNFSKEIIEDKMMKVYRNIDF